MLKGFKDFILRGNVIELAVAVVIGSAFTAIVTAFTDSIINPLIAALGTSPEVDGLAIELRAGDAATRVDFGAVISAGLNFLIIAAVVYFILVAPMNKLNEMQAKRHGIEEDKEEKVSIEANLLSEIRDLLKEQEADATGGNHRA
ncbi:large-conductance mechanosensitive channel protein MscL [Corynebacterium sp. zg-331]|uniref:large-conductance mechanosensitive channel protein MscL n=1 Tax=unclassified Corynebacterium TaxID=2624378 RepID=UPI00128C5966|nr:MULTISPECIES: large-conductance mechanosensitive channel protein MscL [unclassified Corynebacterium]MBC3186323.1 large-conductance mechanosensitive channel protein MscL [Corynebacterium sp. zg-331]MPV52811.1 large-conductance mechanosensitive channel protein MscL [Corynebacterium sp. zg331]